MPTRTILHDPTLAIQSAYRMGQVATSAPKQAALAMIQGMEPNENERGAYCGALGLVTGERSALSLLIRTAARSAEDWV